MNSEIHCLLLPSAISVPSPGTLHRSPSNRMASLVSTSSANSRSMLIRLMNCRRLRPNGVRTWDVNCGISDAFCGIESRIPAGLPHQLSQLSSGFKSGASNAVITVLPRP
jgi:hypothetical protein